MIRFPAPAGPIVAGICATFTGVGIQRFAYALLLPALVKAGWLSGGAAGALGAVNFGGYLLGAAFAPAIGRALGLSWALRGAMLLGIACLSLCAMPSGFVWLAPWRALSGVSGGVLMVLAGPAVQAVVPAGMRGLAAGLVFAGVGSGIAIGAFLVPAMLPHGIPAAWLALACLVAALTVISWRNWPRTAPPPRLGRPRLGGSPGRLVAAYSLAAVAQAAHMVWLPDFIARGLDRGTETGAWFWILYGVSAASGPALCGRLADRIGAARSLRLVMAVQAVALALPLLSGSTPALIASTIGAGATAVGSTALTLIRARELAGAEAVGIWRVATAAFGFFQTLAAFLYASLYTTAQSHTPIFAVAMAAAAGALWLCRRG